MTPAAVFRDVFTFLDKQWSSLVAKHQVLCKTSLFAQNSLTFSATIATDASCSCRQSSDQAVSIVLPIE